MAAFRLAELRRLFLHRYGRTLPDDDAGREDLWMAVNHIALGGVDVFNRCQRFVGEWAPWLPGDEAKKMVEKIIAKPYRFRAGTLCQRLRLTEAERILLKIKTIRAIDATESPAQRKTRKQRERRADARAKRPPPLTASKPWEAEGICRRTWERRRVAKPDANISSADYYTCFNLCDRRLPVVAVSQSGSAMKVSGRTSCFRHADRR
jgi:hypothetical protein